MAEYTAVANQTIPPGEYAIFTATTVPCRTGNVRHSDGTSNFFLKGDNKCYSNCCCSQNATDYDVDFSANIAVSTGETVGPISVAVTVGGTTVPASTMISTPAAVEEFNSVSKSISVPIWNNCCQTVAIKNTSNVSIDMSNAVIRIRK